VYCIYVALASTASSFVCARRPGQAENTG
jgi:hypothetical protein